jgi:hypothetical protein
VIGDESKTPAGSLEALLVSIPIFAYA